MDDRGYLKMKLNLRNPIQANCWRRGHKIFKDKKKELSKRLCRSKNKSIDYDKDKYKD